MDTLYTTSGQSQSKERKIHTPSVFRVRLGPQSGYTAWRDPKTKFHMVSQLCPSPLQNPPPKSSKVLKPHTHIKGFARSKVSKNGIQLWRTKVGWEHEWAKIGLERCYRSRVHRRAPIRSVEWSVSTADPSGVDGWHFDRRVGLYRKQFDLWKARWGWHSRGSCESSLGSTVYSRSGFPALATRRRRSDK